MSIELILNDYYSRNDLKEKGLYMVNFDTFSTIFADSDGNGYLFKNIPLKRLKLTYNYRSRVELPITDVYTEYDMEKITDDVMNCSSLARLGL